MPSDSVNADPKATTFSTNTALEHVKALAATPHSTGFEGHKAARNYIVTALQKMGLETSTQEGFTAGDWANLSKPINILAKIKGSEKGKSLVLLSHYDSNPHSSFGASDAASGVATILEGVRAFLANNPTPKNDIIILITDGEELGLNGADLFVSKHPWAKNVGLVLNFEARGSGGPSYMLIETNRGNSTLIREFTKANPKYPMANSLVYSIYKMLPNDTDLTVFREQGDIEGLNFAFIDDHYDYHTALDTYDRLDKNTLAHQGSYLMPLLTYFSDADITQLKSLNDDIYFNVPLFKLVSYPFNWIWPMFALGVILFILLLVHGFKKGTLDAKEIGLGFIPMLLALLGSGLIGYYSWPILKVMYPQYTDMLHGFTYNGYWYIAAFVALAISSCFLTYHRFKKLDIQNILVAPIFIWLLICGGVAAKLPGASFFIIPTYGLLMALLVYINQQKPNALLLLCLTLPALAIYAPFIKMFPVGLGLKMMVAATLLTALTFLLVLPLFGAYKNKKRYGYASLILGIAFLLVAHSKASFNEERPKPTSLNYVYNVDSQTAVWATHEKILADWTAAYIDESKKTPEALNTRTPSSKYGTNFSYITNAEPKRITPPLVTTTTDTIIGALRYIDMVITPQRPVNRLDLFTKTIAITSAVVNDVPLSDYYLKNRGSGKLLTHHIANNNPTVLQLSFPTEETFELTLYEASNDLLTNPLFSVPARKKNTIPMPFVLNDAVIIIKTISFE